MKRVLFIVFGFLGIFFNQAPGQETTYDVEYTRVCLIDSIAADTLVQFWRFTQSNNPGGFTVDVTYDLSAGYTPTGTLLPCCSCLTAASDTYAIAPAMPRPPSPGLGWWVLFIWLVVSAGFWIIYLFLIFVWKRKPLRIAYFLPMALLFSYSSLSAQSETRYDIEFECICLIDSIAPDTIIQFYRFTQANNPGGNVVDVTYDLSAGYTPTGTVLGCNDYYLGDNVNTGGGTAGTLAIWTGAYSLGNSSVTESGGNVVGTSFTGAFGLAVGTTAQRPTGSNGLIRYSTTLNEVEAWNGGTAQFQSLFWKPSGLTANYYPYWNGSTFVDSRTYRPATYTIIADGNGNSTSGQYNFIGTGFQNSIQYRYSFIGSGNNNTITGASVERCFIGAGNTNSVAASYSSVVGGQTNSITAGGNGFIGGGTNNVVSASAGFVGGGIYSSSYQLSQYAHAADRFSVAGDAQYSRIIAGRLITGVDSSRLLIGSYSGTGNTIVTPNNSTWNVIVTINAVVNTPGSGGLVIGDSGIYTRQFGVKRAAGAATIALMGTPVTIGTDVEDTNMATARITVVANTTNGSIDIFFVPPTTADANTITRVVATLHITELRW